MREIAFLLPKNCQLLEDHGAEVAFTVARGLVVYLRRPGSQTQFSTILRDQYKEPGQFDGLTSWMMSNLHRPLNVELLSEHCAMSPRHFSRQFVAAFGKTPAKYLQDLRLEAAKIFLTETDLALDQIARKCGITNADLLRRSFIRNFQMNPGEYRKLWRKSK